MIQHIEIEGEILYAIDKLTDIHTPPEVAVFIQVLVTKLTSYTYSI